MAKPKEQRLGRGIKNILSGNDLNTVGSSSINEIELNKIEPNPDQPRTVFDAESLEELAASIRSYGIIQPIILKEVAEDKYMIIAGERRYRAAQMVELERIPAYIRTAADENVAEMALIENIQREDLNAIEIALAYQRLLDIHGFTQEKLSEKVGKKRATIANYLRLLRLPAEIQVGVKNKRIDMGHARALVTVDDPELQLALYEQILEEGLSVRNTEELAKNASSTETVAALPSDEKPEKTEKKQLPDEYGLLQKHLSEYFQTKVNVTYQKNGKGKIMIPFRSEEELEKIVGLLDKMKQ
ncbi:MAG: ParB/RepB/Spo0J family partition protein [Tannerella sp.]|jgi:ParB family chromosome partitioning protein|nr:ParB/RepB/Spo0J family partition protein [Tannerella sp.]